jgi:hypothetical protein
MVNYKVKNILRTFGKSSFIFISVFASAFLMLVGGSFSQ